MQAQSSRRKLGVPVGLWADADRGTISSFPRASSPCLEEILGQDCETEGRQGYKRMRIASPDRVLHEPGMIDPTAGLSPKLQMLEFSGQSSIGSKVLQVWVAKESMEVQTSLDA